MRLILHIGTEKTATTTIQHFLYQSRAALAEKGIVLSDVLGSPNNRKLPAYYQSDIRLDEFFRKRQIRTIQQKEAFFDGFEDEFRGEVAALAKTADCMVITSEHLRSALQDPGDIQKLHGLLAPLFSEIRVVCYFREQSAMVKSLYSTGIKSGVTKTFDEVLLECTPQEHRYNYHASFSKWAAVFGMDNMQARLFQKDQLFQGDICADFLQIVDPQLTVGDFDPLLGNMNESLGYRGIELGRINNVVNAKYHADGAHSLARRRVLGAIMKTGMAQQGGLDVSAAPEIHAAFDASNRAFAKAFLGRPDNPFPAPPPFSTPGDAVDSVPVAEFMGFWQEFLTVMRNASALTDSHAEALRSLAARIESGDTLSAKDAKVLMVVAHRIRPDAKPAGKLIKKTKGGGKAGGRVGRRAERRKSARQVRTGKVAD